MEQTRKTTGLGRKERGWFVILLEKSATKRLELVPAASGAAGRGWWWSCLLNQIDRLCAVIGAGETEVFQLELPPSTWSILSVALSRRVPCVKTQFVIRAMYTYLLHTYTYVTRVERRGGRMLSSLGEGGIKELFFLVSIWVSSLRLLSLLDLWRFS